MVNVLLLQDAMRAKSITVDQAAFAMGVDRATFYRRMNRAGSKFTVEEVSKLSALLNLSAAEMQDIFFAEQLA